MRARQPRLVSEGKEEELVQDEAPWGAYDSSFLSLRLDRIPSSANAKVA